MKYLCLAVIVALILYSLNNEYYNDITHNDGPYEKDCPRCNKNSHYSNCPISSITDYHYHHCPKCNRIWCSNDDE